jgi:hypothetical protein
MASGMRELTLTILGIGSTVNFVDWFGMCSGKRAKHSSMESLVEGQYRHVRRT